MNGKNTKKNLENLLAEISQKLSQEPDSEEKAWILTHDFYNIILTYMEKNNITRSSLAKKLGVSRAAISRKLNGTPNISIKKMVEIADAIGVEIKITSPMIERIMNEFQSEIDIPNNASGTTVIKKETQFVYLDSIKSNITFKETNEFTTQQLAS